MTNMYLFFYCYWCHWHLDVTASLWHTKPKIGCRWAFVVLAFVMCFASLALVEPSVAFQPIQHTDSQVDLVSEREHSDWPFSLVNQCARRKTGVTKVSKWQSQESTNRRFFSFFIFISSKHISNLLKNSYEAFVVSKLGVKIVTTSKWSLFHGLYICSLRSSSVSRFEWRIQATIECMC